jgi:hypothetical protein
MPILTKTIYGDGKVYFGDSAINYASIGVAEVYFQGYSINQGAIEGADFVRFTDDSQNFNSVECDIIQIIQRAVNRGQMEAFTRALFNDYAENSSMGIIASPYVVIGGDVILDGTTTAAVVTISGNAEIQGEIYASVSVEFLDYASSTATAIISGNVSFKANSLNNGGAIIGNVSLFDNASNTGSVSGDVELYDTASNTGSVSGDVELYDNASNTGSVSGNIELNDNASNSGSSTGDVITYSSITLNSANYLYAGTLSSGITIILDGNKTLVANISGTDTINGTNSNWSTNGSGILTYSAVGGINPPSITSISADDLTPGKEIEGLFAAEPFTITVIADDGGDPQNITYQWQILNAGWDNISGATQSTYSSYTRDYPNTTQFRCVVTNSAGSVESSIITITPVDPAGIIISTITNTTVISLANGSTQTVNNGVINTVTDGLGGTNTVCVYPPAGDSLYTYNELRGISHLVGTGINQSVNFQYNSDGNGGYTEIITYPPLGYELGTISNSYKLEDLYSLTYYTYYYDVKVIADGDGGHTDAPQYPAADTIVYISTNATNILLPNNLPSYTYYGHYTSDGDGTVTFQPNHPTIDVKLGTAENAGSITSPSGTLTFNIGYWGDGNGGYTAINEVIAGTTIGEDQDYTYVVNGSLDGYDAIPKA